MPETFKVLISELKGLCLDMKLEQPDKEGRGKSARSNAAANA